MNDMSRKFNPAQILAIVGPTASGKSSLAIEIAKKYSGEIISADSRQIYRGMDIGTGKVTIKEQLLAKHHLIDIREPNEDYNVTDFKRDAEECITDIQNRGKLPIICGGTFFWVQALIDNQSFPVVPPNPKIRKKLSKLSTEELFKKLKTLDPKRAETIDAKNPIRLIRAIEIATALGSVPLQEQTMPNEDYFIIAINPPKEILDAKIKKRLDERFNQGMIEEIQTLHNQGISFERLESFGLEYRWIAVFLQEKIDNQTMKEKLYFDIIHYAKRQLTWLRRWEKQGAQIHWIRDASEIDTFL
jgi:tRNA dimethylallyltransferase